MKIYKLIWYLYTEDQLKESLITDKEVAEARYQEGSLSWMLVIPLRISRKRRPCTRGW